ncbi:Heavy metal-associated isoprenylated plant protein [Heracleum sosnowskyi]|uniref:Heavy metal-associated isoprenylated plant protein n=1 Tax=Heracleum sosnowskyi TaxID=360622 RepID=A0AAD8J7C7_9APIA|nr:Heavy metal-associated isoprenylated plant protein [Heracleum sosnowskyi]
MAEDEKQKWVNYYSSSHEILLVGEGDFSFSSCLALSFASAPNIVATSLDSYEDVIKSYHSAQSNLSILDKAGASHLHEVDATKMKSHSGLQARKFDRIIFNFPHAGFHGKEDDALLIVMHRSLLNGFFKNASGMLRPDGEIHVNHKTSNPYCNWKLEELAGQNSLRLIECVAFKKEDYPGYENKRGSSSRCDQSFPLGICCTFKFSFSYDAWVAQIMKRPQNPFEFRRPLSDGGILIDEIVMSVIFESYLIFGGYLKHVREALESPDHNSYGLHFQTMH